MPSGHGLFLADAQTLECVHCRNRWSFYRDLSVDEVTHHIEMGAKYSTHVLVNRPIGFCLAKRKVYVNTSPNVITMDGLGIAPVGPGEVFEVGEKTTYKQIKSYAPQVQSVDHIERKETCGLDLLPLTIDELVRFTTHTGAMLYYVGYVSPRT